jgi:hypothetical protein
MQKTNQQTIVAEDGDTVSEGKNIDNNTHREKNRREPKMKTDR